MIFWFSFRLWYEKNFWFQNSPPSNVLIFFFLFQVFQCLFTFRILRSFMIGSLILMKRSRQVISQLYEVISGFTKRRKKNDMLRFLWILSWLFQLHLEISFDVLSFVNLFWLTLLAQQRIIDEENQNTSSIHRVFRSRFVVAYSLGAPW